MLSPAFPFGGMEHPGVTMFNEESFIYREPPTLNQRLGRRATIYHEVAHHWFGDDVTMQWFDDLWLKEGFATYMAAKMQDIDRGDSGRIPWMSFYLRNKPAAYDVDQTSGTTPVWQQLANLDQAKSNYGAIVYNKAPGILKQLNYLVGDAAFRAGASRFPRRARRTATRRGKTCSRRSARRRTARSPSGGNSTSFGPACRSSSSALEIAERQDQAARADPAPGADSCPAAASGRCAPRSCSGRRGTAPTSIPVEIRAETTVVAAAAGRRAPDFVFANANDNAYGLVMLDPPERALARRARRRSARPVPARDAVGRDVGSRARRAPRARRFHCDGDCASCPHEPDEQIAAGIVGASEPRDVELSLRRAAGARYRAGVEDMLLAGASNAQARLRDAQEPARRVHLGRAHAGGAWRARAWLDSASTAGIPLRQPTRWSIVTHLVERGAPNADALIAAEARRDTTANGRRSAFVAGAARPQPAVKASTSIDTFATRRSTKTGRRRASARSTRRIKRRRRSPISFRRSTSLPWIQKNRRIFFLGSWLGGFIGGQRSPDALRRSTTSSRSTARCPRTCGRKSCRRATISSAR